MPQDSIRQQQLDQKRGFWSTHITSWQASRVNQTEYCRRHELKFHQFVYWRQKFAPKPAAAVSLVQVPVAAVEYATGCNPWPTTLRVTLAPDLCIEVSPGFEPPTLQQVVTALRGIR
jgi:hypothetical protein